MDPERFGAFLAGYLDATTRLHHPGSLAHQVAAPDVPSALADLVHGVINNPMAIYEMGAAALAIELATVEWMLEQVGWSAPESAGVLTHGGSLANLTAMLAARARAAPGAWVDGVPGDLALLAPAPRRTTRWPAASGSPGSARTRSCRSRPTSSGASARPAGRTRSSARARRAGGRWPWWPRLRDGHRPLRRPARDRRVVPRARACGSTWTGRTAPRRSCPSATAGLLDGIDAGGLGGLGRAQDAAHVEPLRRGAGAPRARPARRLPPGGELPLLRGLEARASTSSTARSSARRRRSG